jgi:hypothetical protein
MMNHLNDDEPFVLKRTKLFNSKKQILSKFAPLNKTGRTWIWNLIKMKM